ncbi:MAG: hypothetical protein P4L33_22400 [Capsulimonadaceae bacterium]|nr:hypothetical protein [Capsulimonadaceae bacterium]
MTTSRERRVNDLPGPNLVVSPSHEALQPSVPPENVQAMAEAAAERPRMAQRRSS